MVHQISAWLGYIALSVPEKRMPQRNQSPLTVHWRPSSVSPRSLVKRHGRIWRQEAVVKSWVIPSLSASPPQKPFTCVLDELRSEQRLRDPTAFWGAVTWASTHWDLLACQLYSHSAFALLVASPTKDHTPKTPPLTACGFHVTCLCVILTLFPTSSHRDLSVTGGVSWSPPSPSPFPPVLLCSLAPSGGPGHNLSAIDCYICSPHQAWFQIPVQFLPSSLLDPWTSGPS